MHMTTFSVNDRIQQQPSSSITCLARPARHLKPWLVVFKPYDDDASRNCARQCITVHQCQELAADFV